MQGSGLSGKFRVSGVEFGGLGPVAWGLGIFKVEGGTLGPYYRA